MRLLKGVLFYVIVWSAVVTVACGGNPIGASSTFSVSPNIPNQEWRGTNPSFTASGGTGQYSWQLNFGDGLLIPMGQNMSKAEFRPNRPGAFSASVFSGNASITVYGTIVQ